MTTGTEPIIDGSNRSPGAELDIIDVEPTDTDALSGGGVADSGGVFIKVGVKLPADGVIKLRPCFSSTGA